MKKVQKRVSGEQHELCSKEGKTALGERVQCGQKTTTMYMYIPYIMQYIRHTINGLSFCTVRFLVFAAEGDQTVEREPANV